MNYPNTLPSPRLNKSTVTLSQNINTQNYELGSKISRKESNLSTYDFNVVLTKDEFKEFFNFYKSIHNGLDTFTTEGWSYLTDNSSSDVFEFFTEIKVKQITNDLFSLESTVRN